MTLSLLDLPAEVRQQIWRYVTCDAYVSTVRHLPEFQRKSATDRCGSAEVDHDDTKRPWTFLLTCKLVWNEAHHLYFTCDTLRTTWMCLIYKSAPKHLIEHVHTIQLIDYCRDCWIGLRESDANIDNLNRGYRPSVQNRLQQYDKLESIYLPNCIEDEVIEEPVGDDVLKEDASSWINATGPWHLEKLETAFPNLHFIFDIEARASTDSMLHDVVSQ